MGGGGTSVITTPLCWSQEIARENFTQTKEQWLPQCPFLVMMCLCWAQTCFYSALTKDCANGHSILPPSLCMRFPPPPPPPVKELSYRRSACPQVTKSFLQHAMVNFVLVFIYHRIMVSYLFTFFDFSLSL